MSENKALDASFDALNSHVEEQLLAELQDPALREHVRTFGHPAMVRMLAKPGVQILESLDFLRFVGLMNACSKLVNCANGLDFVKKQVVYNKDMGSAVPETFALPTSQKLNDALEDMTPEKAHLLHMAVGFAGEAGEMLEAILNHVLGSELDVENVVEEGGDAAFYLQGLIGADSVQMGLSHILLANKVKLLGKRYRNGYSDTAAQERADKEPGK